MEGLLTNLWVTNGGARSKTLKQRVKPSSDRENRENWEMSGNSGETSENLQKFGTPGNIIL